MTAQHTPGPWKITTASGGREIAESITGRLLCEVYNAPGTDNREANARLIAACPAMLEALIIVSKSSGFARLNPVAQRRVNEAIDKATREE